LIIKPTLQDSKLIENNNVLNLTQLGTCTSSIITNCVAMTNTTNGTIVNPVKSARLNTKKKGAIRYGKVEVVAKLPIGDWLWPAIWMLPVKETYGPWPASGEIDIMESRGNNYTQVQGGNNVMSSALHWGPDPDHDLSYKTFSKMSLKRKILPTAFHTYGLIWTEKHLFTYLDGKLQQVLYTGFRQSFWERGDFAEATANGTRQTNPWIASKELSAPFDQPFYLILDIAVGGTNSWFQDGENGKPWVNAVPTAKKDFWDARDTWQPTWKDGGEMIVDSVKMWQQCD
jgi:beta-glucanase (GH16 family)